MDKFGGFFFFVVRVGLFFRVGFRGFFRRLGRWFLIGVLEILV